MRTHEPLEPRTLLASTFTFSDVDGDQVTIKVTGAGAADVTLSNVNTGSIDFIQLNGTNTQSGLSISVKKGGPGDGRVRLAGVSIAELAKFNAPGADIVEDLSFNEIVSFVAGDIEDARVDVNVSPGKVASITLRNLIDGELGVNGAGAALKLNSSDGNSSVDLNGFVKSLKCAGDLGGELSALRFGAVSVTGFLSAALKALTPDAKGYTYGAIKAQAVKGGSLQVDLGGEAGRVKSVTTDLWASGGLSVRAVDTIKIKGDFAPDFVELQENRDDAFALKSMTIGGTADAPFDLGARVGAIKIFACGGDLEFHDNTGLVHVKSLTITGPDGARGSYGFTSIGTLKVTAVMSGEWTLGGGDPLSRSIVSLKAGRIDQCQFASSGGIVSMTVGRVFDSTISTFFIGTLSVKPGAFGDGTFGAVNLLVTGDNLGQSIKVFSVKGECGGSDIRTTSTIGSLSALRLNGLALNIGDVSQSAFEAFNGPIAVDTVINSFTLTGSFDANQPVFSDSRIVGGRFAKIVIKGFASPTSSLVTHGFAAATFTSVTMKDLNGATIKPAIGDTLADINPFTPASSVFIFRVAFA